MSYGEGQKERDRGRILSRLHAQHGANHVAQSVKHPTLDFD